MNTGSSLLLLALLVLFVSADIHLDRLRLPKGFKIEVFAENVTNARQMSLTSDESWLFVGTMIEGGESKTYAINMKTKKTLVIADGLHLSNGVAYHANSDTLYIAETKAISKLPNIVKQLNEGVSLPLKPILVREYPDEDWHGWKYIKINKMNDRLYIPQGSPCNTCLKDQNVFGLITSFWLKDPTNYKIHAKGVRNSVGFDWHPTTRQLWFTDNGRDEWGNDRPGDEFNLIENENITQHYGFPFCYEKDLIDTDYNKQGNCNGYVPATYVLGPHAAALGVTFYNSKALNNTNLALIAEHGSWNRDIPFGYRVTMVDVSNRKPESYQVFIDGWLNLPGSNDSDNAWGRPVDIVVTRDGSILISDDKANAIYRVSYSG